MTRPPAPPVVLGVDGCRGGWIGALVQDGAVRWEWFADAAAVLAVPAAVIGIDIPIGLPTAGYRECDRAAREVLRTARNSVFFTPVRGVLDATTYPAANARSRELTGKGLAKQTWHILDRVRDVDEALGDPPDRRVVEVHPEVSFRRLDPRVSAGKKSASGAGQRIRALGDWLDVDAALGDVPAGPSLDDALDALVAAWSAQRWQDGRATVLPTDDPPVDERGRPMRIVS